MPEQDLAAVALFGLLRTIPDEFGGVTTVALQRANALSLAYDLPIDLLTIDPDLDVVAKAREMRGYGMLGDDVRLRNLWEELRGAPDQQLANLTGVARDPVVGDDQLPRTASDAATHRLADDGTVLQVNRFRSDGSLLATDRHDVRSFGNKGGRRLTLFDRQGQVTAQWDSATAFYQSWLDFVTASRRSVVISDSKLIGGLLHAYRRDHVTFVQVLHSPHLEDPNGSTYGRISTAKKNLLTHLDNYDVVTTLTESQRAEMLATDVAVDNLVTVPNAFTGDIVTDIEPRTPTRGVVVARLTGVKRLDHAVRAISEARSHGATLDVYGSGPSGNRLQRLVDDLDVSDRVRFRGFDPHAREQFAEASFTLMTSQFEGQGVTLLESMAAGCIPIAYDIRYGPASIITHGVDGFLVPAGDIQALTATLVHVTSLDEASLRPMRHAAVRRATQYRPEAVAEQWATLLSNAVASKQPGVELAGRAALHDAEMLTKQLRLSVVLTGCPDNEPDWACLTWIGRATNVYGRIRATITVREKDCLLEADVPLQRLPDLGTGALVDMFVDIRNAGVPGRLRIATSAVVLPTLPTNTELYTTAHGNLSIRGHGRNDGPVHTGSRGIRVWLRRHPGLAKRLRRVTGTPRLRRLLHRGSTRAGT